MSDICRVYTTEIATPIAISLRVEMTDGGLVDHIEGFLSEEVPLADEIRAARAVLLLTPTILNAQSNGVLLEDVLDEMPAEPDFAIEHAILTALVDLQKGRLLDHIQTRGAA